MSADIRELDSEDDLDRVAEFFARSGYGPAGGDVTGTALGRVFRERGMRLFLVAEERGRIVATIGYAAMSGRRVAPQGQLFAGMFVIAPTHRTGALAGRLFTESFERLVASGIRGLRVEVDPANSRAFPLYVRVGFRALDGMTPDEDGYVELVSLLPGVTSDLVDNATRWIGRSVSEGTRSWRSIRSSRAQSVDSGIVRLPGSVDAIRYDFELPGLLISATARADDAAVISLSVNGSPASAFTPPGASDGASPVRVTSSRALGAFTVTLDDRGTLVVSHAAHVGAVVVDPHPIASGACAGPRRPPSRPLIIDTAAESWRVDDGDVERVVRFLPTGLRVISTSRKASEVVGFPWTGLRVARLALSREDVELRAGHAVRGRWPVDRVDFEASADASNSWPAEGTEVVWSDEFTGVGVAATRLRGRTVRLEGWHVARLTGEGMVGYDLALTSSERPAGEYAGHGGRVIHTWRRSRRALADVIQTTIEAGTVTVAARAGLVEWTRDGVQVLSSPFPSRRTIGPLRAASVALWVCAQPDRAEIDHGAVWPTDGATLSFQSTGDGGGVGWSLVSLDTPTDLGVRVSAVAEGAAREAVVYLMLTRARSVRFADADGAAVVLDVSPEPWRTWTREASFVMDHGRLHLTPLRGTHPEILIRSTAQGLIIAAYSRLTPELTAAVWRLRWDAS